MLSGRAFLGATAGLPLAATDPPLGSLTRNAKPISVDERRARIAKLQSLMAQRKVSALLMEPGSTLDYFTGVQGHRSERITVALIPAQGLRDCSWTSDVVAVESLRYIHDHLQRGMNATTVSLGGSAQFSLVLLNEASAYPDGSLQAQAGADFGGPAASSM